MRSANPEYMRRRLREVAKNERVRRWRRDSFRRIRSSGRPLGWQIQMMEDIEIIHPDPYAPPAPKYIFTLEAGEGIRIPAWAESDDKTKNPLQS